MRIARQLALYLAQPTPAPFDWRTNNCCHFAARWMVYATGFDPMAGLPETPDGRRALKLVQRLGGTLADAWTRALGRQPIAAALAQTGDIVLVPVAPEGTAMQGTGQAVGICSGHQVILLDVSGRHAFLSVRSATCAWRLEGVPA
jgi:hypothetical protein